jgi:hypothetical protein
MYKSKQNDEVYKLLYLCSNSCSTLVLKTFTVITTLRVFFSHLLTYGMPLMERIVEFDGPNFSGKKVDCSFLVIRGE